MADIAKQPAVAAATGAVATDAANTVTNTPAAPAAAPNSSSNSNSNNNDTTTPKDTKEQPQVVPQTFPPLPLVTPQTVRKFDDDPTLYIKGWILSLLYWEKPYRSGAFFSVLMSVLVLTQYYSLLQLTAAFFTIVTGLNWVYVNTHKQGQRVFGGKPSESLSNPHQARLTSKDTYIPKQKVLRTGELTVDVVEAVVQELTKLVLIQDSMRSAWAVGIAYSVWTLATYISTKYLVGLFIVGAFSLPKLYQQNQQVIDKQVAHYTHHGKQLFKQYSSQASVKAKEIYGQAMATVTKKSKKAE
ncbi:Reticulon-domain-containing protein [Zychaea mexicana]|uniref:Reticulon-domain-containing protein n=1 Tax=Zychaea mexicana TaxID=64656 RepID=UPI0022FE0380|nr:Reticulon-domain-containing protein [Zychaea mexicana]KAI9484508.1 Reticulon-domain-containing protein [Zychaea mexicana]